jgi:hypothetical protein
MAKRIVAAAFRAAMETIHAGYWQISSRAAINGYRWRRFHRVTPRATSTEKKGMVVKKGRCLSLVIAGTVFSVVAVTGVFAQSDDVSAPTRTRYLPEYTASGDLVLPKNFNEWVFVGSPLTPNALKRHRWLSR